MPQQREIRVIVTWDESSPVCVGALEALVSSLCGEASAESEALRSDGITNAQPLHCAQDAWNRSTSDANS